MLARRLDEFPQMCGGLLAFVFGGRGVIGVVACLSECQIWLFGEFVHTLFPGMKSFVSLLPLVVAWEKAVEDFTFEFKFGESGETILLSLQSWFSDDILQVPIGSVELAGSAFQADALVPIMDGFGGSAVNGLWIGLDSAFARTNPLFALRPSEEGFLLSVDEQEATQACDTLSYYPAVESYRWWSLEGGVVKVEGEVVEGHLAMDILTGHMLALTPFAHQQLRAAIDMGAPHLEWTLTSDGYLESADCSESDIAFFPTITISIGAHSVEILPEDYAAVGTSANMDAGGCTVLVAESSDSVYLGKLFLEKSLVVFDNANRRLGFCRIEEDNEEEDIPE